MLLSNLGMLAAALGLASLAYLAYRYIKPKDKDGEDPAQDQDQDKNDPPYKLRTRPLVPAVDLKAYTYM